MLNSLLKRALGLERIANDLVLLLTLYRFCLTEGFAGRYAGAPDRLKERTDGLDRELQRLTPRRVRAET